MEKYSFERRASESVDNGSPSWVTYMSQIDRKQIQAVKG